MQVETYLFTDLQINRMSGYLIADLTWLQIFKKVLILFCIVFYGANTIRLSTSNSRSKKFPLMINCKFSGHLPM